MLSRRAKLLVVEDEAPHRLLVRRSLETGHDLTFASSVKEALEIITDHSFDLFILDIMLPDGDGFELLKQIRAHDHLKAAPVLFLTAREDISSKLKGFSLGGDDYVTKPCDPLELQARIDAKVRRLQNGQSSSQIRVAGLIMDTARQAVSVEQNGKSVKLDLTPLEFRLLLYMARRPDQPLTREEILKEVWGDNTHVLARSVDSYVAALRKKLGERSRFIRSVHGVGYRFSVPATFNKAS